SERPSAPDIAAAGTPQDIETFDGTIDIDAAAHGAARADGIEVQEEVVLEPRAMEVEGLAHTQYESGMFAPPPQAAEPQEDLPTIDLPLIMPDDLVEPPPPPARSGPGRIRSLRPPPCLPFRRPIRRPRWAVARRSRARSRRSGSRRSLNSPRRAKRRGRRRTASRSMRCSARRRPPRPRRR